jgi:RNA polymerase primary sigma factor
MSAITDPFDEMEIVSTLLAEATERGYITYDQILEALPEVEKNLALLEIILEEMQGAGVTIYESEDEVTSGEATDGSGVNEKPHAAPLFDLSNVPIDDSVGLYFREMGQQQLLSAEEEVQLAKEIEAGNGAMEIATTTELDQDESFDNSRIVEIGDAARAHLIRANTRLVVSIAKKYRGRGLQFLDLIQEGNVGLMKAVEKYDYRRGNRFSTYALYQIAQELEQELGRQPTAEEIAENMDLPAERVRWMLRTSRQPVHLERPVGDESDAELGDFIEDVELPQPAETVANNMLTEEIGEILDQLTPREARILRLRYGLQDGESRTLKEVGEMFGLSRERIRQLEKEALRKLRHPNFAGHLRQYLH